MSINVSHITHNSQVVGFQTQRLLDYLTAAECGSVSAAEVNLILTYMHAGTVRVSQPSFSL